MIAKNKKENITCWYLLYTNPRAEKKVAEELQKKGFEVFLPLQRTLKVWSDRKKWVEEPLFKSYLFVYTELEKNFYTILNTNGIVKFISFRGKTAVVDEREIDMVKKILGDLSFYPESVDKETLKIGDEVEIVKGPLIGNKARLVQTRAGDKILIELNSMQQHILISIDSVSVLKLNPEIS